MKKIFLLIAFSMAFTTLFAQSGDGYDPENPGDPNPCYKLYLEASPKNAGSVNTSHTQLVEGQTFRCSASPNMGYKFVKWMNGDAVVSTDSEFYYTMPDENVKLIAYFKYDPSNPGDPSIDGYSHDVHVYANPSVGGYFNSNNFSLKEGQTTEIYAYPNSNFRFVSWKQNGTIISTSNPLEITMGDSELSYTAQFVYDPQNPGNPSANSFNLSTGDLIMDDFEPGYLNYAIEETMGNNSYSSINSVTIIGEMHSYDFGFSYYMNNCSTINLARTTGYTAIPSWSFEEMSSLIKIVLPSSLERINSYAFYGCSWLSEIECYAEQPPVINNSAFDESLEGLIVRVPSSAVAEYMEAEVWKNFTILSLDQEVCNLTVNLPADAVDGRYKNMTLDVKNVSNGQAVRYIITDKISYSFANLSRNSTYNIIVKNTSGAMLGCIYDVLLVDEVQNATFESLLQPQDVTINILDSDNNNVASQTKISWFDKDGKYITQGQTLKGILEGTQLKYRIELSKDLAMQYVMPTDTEYIVKSSDNEINVVLNPFEEITITGFVKDKAIGSPISYASVSITQTMNDMYSKSVVVTTDNTGKFTANVYKTACKVVVAANDYMSNTINIDDIENTEALNNILLKEITGVKINTLFTYTKSVVDGEESVTENYYNDYVNVSYSVFNKTTQSNLTEFNIQYPYIVMIGNINVGDVLSVTATSRNNMFEDVTAEGTVNEDNIVTVTFPIVEHGKLQSSYNESGTSKVVGILYDSNKQFIRKSNYSNNAVVFDNLIDGEYTLVTMKNSDLFNSILNYSDLNAIGLEEGVHYTKNDVTIESGKITEVAINEIYDFDESEFYYTGDNTQFTVNKPSVTAGNYVTLRAKVDFKPVYASGITDVKLIFNLPNTCEFVNNSVMIGNSLGNYTIGENRVEVEMTNINDLVRFCITPTEGGTCNPNAMVQFKYNGEEILQPIGSAMFEVKNLEINVPSITADKEIAVSGVCKELSVVEIYDNDVLVANTTALANGNWSVKCTLNNAYNLSRHYIYAKVTTRQGAILQSETKEVIYGKNEIQVSKVIMYHWNPEMGRTYESVFDFINPSSQPNSWTVYYPDKKFSYTIEFTLNDPEMISNVVLYVHTADGGYVPCSASYDSQKGLWYAEIDMGSSNNGYYPVNCSVDFDAYPTITAESELIDGSLNKYSELQNDYVSAINSLDSLMALYDEERAKEMPDFDLIDDYEQAILNSTNHYSNITPTIYDESELENFLNQCDLHIQDTINAMSEEYLALAMEDVNSYMQGITYSTCDGIDEAGLLELGYEKISKTDKTSFYVFSSDEYVRIADISMNLLYEINLNDADPVLRDLFLLRGDKSFVSTILSYKDGLQSASDKLRTCMSTFVDLIDNIDAKLTMANKLMGDDLVELQANLKYLRANNGNPILIGIMESKFNLLAKKVAINDKILTFIDNLTEKGGIKVGRLSGGLFAAFDLIMVSMEMVNDLTAVIDLYCSIPDPCPEEEAQAVSLQNAVRGVGIGAGIYYTSQIVSDALAMTSAITGLSAAVPTAGASLSGVAVSIALVGANLIASEVYSRTFDNNMNSLNSQIQSLECEPEPDPDPDPKPKPKPGGGHHKPNSPDDNVLIDPSGYVYEGVSSNRVEGVMASCYYKEFVEDMYGDIIEKVVLWDAEAYAQENPLFTDENGMYRWDVPQGLWQVKFEKEGYETTYSEWLPVPPPQLEVNIPITQYAQPNVISAVAYQDAIEVQFDKYMLPVYLTTDNIVVTSGGNVVSGTIELLDEEECYEGFSTSYASKVRFNAEEQFPDEEVTILVKNNVKSYAHVKMQDDFMQTFTVEMEMQKIVCPSNIFVNYNEEKTIEVSVIPAAAAKGKTLNVKSMSPLILSVNVTSVVLDEEGKTQIKLKGELPGTASLSFDIEGYDINAQSSVKVEKKKTYQSEQTVTLSEGWNWFSTYLEIEGEDGLKRIQDALGSNAEQIKNQFAFSSYNSAGWFGLLDDASTESMYMIKMSEEAEFSMDGNVVDPSEYPITLEQNWTWLGYILNEEMSLEDALVSITPNNNDQIKSQSGFNTYYNGSWYGETILNFEPGKGYMYNNTSNTAKTLVYPSNSSKGRHVNNTVIDKHWTVDINKYPTNMSVIAVVNMDGKEMSDCEIGAFSNGECRGSARPIYVDALDRYLLFLTIHGEGEEEISFKYYDVTADEEYEFEADENINYFVNGILGSMTEPYVLNFGTMNVDECLEYSFAVYPNPVNRNNEIYLGTICDRVEVYNSIGVKIADYEKVGTIEGIDVPGVYIINAINNNSVKYCRIIVK